MSSTIAEAAPLAGVKVLEAGGIGPVPFAGMLLAELGAQVTRIERPGAGPIFAMPPQEDLLQRGKTVISLDLTSLSGLERARGLIRDSDILLEGLRPGVMERLGLGPEQLRTDNPGLIYGRMTGWGQSGPRAHTAGHDINYISLTGALHAVGSSAGPPVIPLNVVGDFGGGSLYLVVGVLASLADRGRSGRGRTVDAAIVDGVTHLLTLVHALRNAGLWRDEREANLFDGGAPFYAVYETSDAGHIAVGAVEPRFYANLLEVLGQGDLLERQYDRAAWRADRAAIAQIFRSRDRHYWERAFEGLDVCATPVLSLAEAARDPHLVARQSLRTHSSRTTSGTAPRFS